MRQRALVVHPPRSGGGEPAEIRDCPGSTLLGQADEAEEDLGRGLGIRERPMAWRGGRAEEMREGGEARARDASRQQAPSEPDRVDDGRGQSPPLDELHLAVDEAEIELDIDRYEGDPLEIGFNPGYITDALKVVDGGDVIIELKAPNKPGVLRTGSEFTYVIMPVNLQ